MTDAPEVDELETLPEEVPGEVDEAEWIRAGSAASFDHAAVAAEHSGGESFKQFMERTDPEGELRRQREADRLRFRDAVSNGAASKLFLSRTFRELGGMPAGAALAAAQARTPRER